MDLNKEVGNLIVEAGQVGVLWGEVRGVALEFENSAGKRPNRDEMTAADLLFSSDVIELNRAEDDVEDGLGSRPESSSDERRLPKSFSPSLREDKAVSRKPTPLR
jgi:hypothetical protein